MNFKIVSIIRRNGVHKEYNVYISMYTNSKNIFPLKGMLVMWSEKERRVKRKNKKKKKLDCCTPSLYYYTRRFCVWSTVCNNNCLTTVSASGSRATAAGHLSSRHLQPDFRFFLSFFFFTTTTTTTALYPLPASTLSRHRLFISIVHAVVVVSLTDRRPQLS